MVAEILSPWSLTVYLHYIQDLAILIQSKKRFRMRYGHENKGLDDHDHEANHLKKGRHDHDRKRHHDDDYDRKGHHNYAMDDDFESRDGSPSVQHMSGGPIGTGV